MDEFEAAMVGRNVGRSEAAEIVAALRAQLAEAEQQRDASAVAAGVLGDSLDTARAQRDRARETAVRLEQEVARLREALEQARHSLVTLHGLTASDGLSAYGDALAEGCDATGAWDCYVEETWQIDEMATIAEIDAALAATRGIAPAAAAPAEPLHPEAYCHRCGGPNWNWQAASHLWNIVMRSRGEVSEQWGIVCPNCFILLAESTGMASSWRLEATDVAEPPTPDPLDVCECGHGGQLHRNVGARCGMWNCGCEEFTPKRREGQG